LSAGVQARPAGGRPSFWLELDRKLDEAAHGWRGPLLAALIALLGALPGLIAFPVLDRDEARFAQASSQMIETGDYVSINLQDQPRFKKPVGIYWMQAVAVRLFSGVEKRQIWAYRIPSLLGAMLAAAACAWGAAAFGGGRRGLVAGAVLGATLILSSEGFIAKTDAVLCGVITLSMAALGRLYAADKDGRVEGRLTRFLFWLGLALSILVKGPIGPMVVALTLLSLWAWERRLPWVKSLGLTWGIALILLVVGPWAMAITVTTDGAFWSGAVGGDMLSKLNESGQEGHGAPPGYHLLLLPLLLFPATVLLPAGAVYAWTCRRRPLVRFALCWLIPSWLVFELSPSKLPHYTLPLFGAVAWLIAGAITSLPTKVVRVLGATLGVLVGGALALAVVIATRMYAPPGALWAAGAGAGLLLAAALAGAIYLVKARPLHALTASLALGLLAHGVIAAAVAPQLKTLWIAKRAAHALDATGLNPRNGITPGPVAVVGMGEPSLVFMLGTETELTTAQGAADAIAEGRPALVDRSQTQAFNRGLAAYGLVARPVGEIQGLNYSKGKPVDLILYRSTVTMPGEGE
jgi:4-amino-4-deoxy-L-arabinose transferase-like glycosyltransferase